MEQRIEDGYAKVKILGKVVEIPVRTVTTIHENGRQDVNVHLPNLTTITKDEGNSNG